MNQTTKRFIIPVGNNKNNKWWQFWKKTKIKKLSDDFWIPETDSRYKNYEMEKKN